MILNIAKRFRAYRSKRIVAAHLARMDDRELADIGIAREDIDLVVHRGRLEL